MADLRGPNNAAQRSTPGGAFADRAWMAWVTRILNNVYVGNSKGLCGTESLRIPAASGSGMILARVTSGSGTAHVCSLYANGSGAAATATGVSVTTPNVAVGEALPVNTWLWVTQIGTTYHGLGTVWL